MENVKCELKLFKTVLFLRAQCEEDNTWKNTENIWVSSQDLNQMLSRIIH